jgi:peptide/nickel transport system substrate-binding protein
MPNHVRDQVCPIMTSLSRGAAIFFLVLLAAGCGRGPVAAGPEELVVGLEGAPLILDPRIAQDAYSERILPLICERPFAAGPDMEAAPELLSSYERPDPLTYVLHLDPGRRLPDGSEMTAADLIYSLNSLGDPALRSPRKYIYDRIESMTAPDAYTVVIKLKEAYAPLPHELTFGIVPDRPGWTPARAFGTGPYQVERFDPGERVVLVPNPRYHGPAPAIQRIVFRVMEDDVTRVLALEHGEVGLLQNCLPPDDVALVANNPRLTLKMQQGINYSYLGLNLDDPLLHDVRVRRAIAYAIDRQTIASCLLRDTVTPATGILAPGHWAYNPDVTVYDYDPARAMALLDEAGFPDPDGPGPALRFHLVFKTSQSKERRWIAQAIGDQLKAVGIGVEVRALEFGTFFNDIRRGNFQIYTLTWPGVTEPDVYYYVFHSASIPPHGGNRNRYRDPEADRLAEAGRLTYDRAERAAIYGQLQQIIATDLPYISLWYSKNTAVMDRRLEGFEFYPGGDYRSLATAKWKE